MRRMTASNPDFGRGFAPGFPKTKDGRRKPACRILHKKERWALLEERLQKILSACGVTSRRGAEQFLVQGRVTVNGRSAQVGDKADLDLDDVRVDGKLLKKVREHTYLMLNKPRGYVTTLSDEQGRPDVSQLIRTCGRRVWPVGRLDLDTDGLLLFTDDGVLTQHLLHPSHEVEKEYHVWVTGNLTYGLRVLCGPLQLDGVPLRPARVEVLEQLGDSAVLSITIHEGKKRQVRRMCGAGQLKVKRLQRVREGGLLLGDLPLGQWRPLTETEIRHLLDA